MKRISVFILVFIQMSCFSQTIEIDTYKAAYSLFMKAQFNDAIDAIDNMADAADLNEQFNYLKADCYFQLNDYENAILYFSRSYKLKNKYSLFRIAESYALLNKPVNACEYLKVYLDQKDKLLRSEVRSNEGFEKITQSKAWIELWKNDFYNNYLKELDEAKYFIENEKHGEAFFILDKLIIKNKNHYRAFEMRGDLHMISGDYKKAANDYSEASKLRKKNVNYQIKEAEAVFKLKKYKKAADLYKGISEKYPYRIDFFVNKAQAEFAANDYISCKNTLSEYLKYSPENAEANFFLAKIYEQENDLINALIFYNNAVSNDESKLDYFVSRGDVYLKTKLFENASDDYSMALDLNPKSGEVYYKRGIAKLSFDKESACKDFQKAISLNYYKANDYIVKYCK